MPNEMWKISAVKIFLCSDERIGFDRQKRKVIYFEIKSWIIKAKQIKINKKFSKTNLKKKIKIK